METNKSSFGKPVGGRGGSIGTSAGRPLASSMGRNSNVPLASRAGLTTGRQNAGQDARPMTSTTRAGFSSTSADGKSFDPLNIGKGPAPPLAEKSENSPEDKARELERKVHKLIEETAEAVVEKDHQKTLEKAKEAGKAERALCKFRETNSLMDQMNTDLTYTICYNLANAYYHNQQYDEALNTYQIIVKSKTYAQSGRLRINMGTIYHEQKKYPQAIKMFRMALDQVPATNKDLRFKIMRNIGNSFVKLGQFQDAIDSYEAVMNGSPDIQTALNLLLCYYARGDQDKMKKHFLKMLSIPIVGMTEEDEEAIVAAKNPISTFNGDVSNTDILSDKTDFLREELTRRYDAFNEKILTAARLIAPKINDDPEDWISGYKWVLDQLRSDFESVYSSLEIDFSMEYMKHGRIEDAIELLKSFEKKDPSLRALASTNLSFIYYLESDYNQAEKYADIAVRSDRYNAKALVNKGNCFYSAGDYQRAREMYLEAVGVQADCIEALYNLGLVNLHLNNIDEAKNTFDKLHTILPSSPEALFQLGRLYEQQNYFEEASKTYERLLNRVPGDPNICSRLGLVYEKLGDDNMACHWHSEAYRYYPLNLADISWLGVWYVKREMYEQAIEYFQRAAVVQPSEVKWRLMVTSCYRRLGDFYKALELYQQVCRVNQTICNS